MYARACVHNTEYIYIYTRTYIWTRSKGGKLLILTSGR